MKKLTVILVLLLVGIGGSAWYYFRKPTLGDFELDKAKQQLIWDSEHVTFEIETYFGKPFAAALKANDDEAIRNLVKDSFQSEVIVDAPPQAESVNAFHRKSWTANDGLQTGDVESFISYFRDRMTGFEKVERAKMRVLKIAQTPGVENGWDTQLLVTVHGLTKQGLPIEISSHHEARFQYNDDDAIHNGNAAEQWKVNDFTLTESTQPLFKEVSKEFGLNSAKLPDNWTRKTSEAKQFLFQIAVEDFDRDGDYDIAVATYEGTPYLLCMEDGKYVNRSRELGLQSWQPSGPGKSALAGWIDIDNDGYVDLLLGPALYKNVGGLRFTNITEESGFVAGYDPHGVSVADYDGDGLLDFYIAKSHHFQQKVENASWVGDNEAGAPNVLWKNLGGGKFADVTDQAHAGGGNRTTFTSSWFYYDDDHLPDLYIANDFAKNVVLRNKGDGTFEDISEASGAADFATSMGVATGDLDNDGTTEIYVANMYSKMGRRIISHVSDQDYPDGIFPQIQGSCAGNRLYQLGSSGKYSDITDLAGVNEVGWAFAPLMCDFDGDGLLDIYATTGFMSFNREKPDG